MNTSISDFIDSLNELKLLLTHFEELENPLSGGNPRVIAATSKSAIVLSCGYFENFLKAAFMEYIDNINKINVPKECVRSKVWSTNNNETLDVLKSFKNKNEDYYGSILITYADSYIKNEMMNKPRLVREAFAITKSNPKTETIKTLFKGIGVTLFKNDIFIVSFENTDLFKRKLDGLIDLRNSYAHGDRAITTSSLTEVDEYITFLENTAHTLKRILDDELNNIEMRHYKDCFQVL